MEINIRNATPLDLPFLLDFARTVGRFISADEIRTWLHVDPEALFVAETSPDGKLIGSCCGTRLTPELGFMGLYVVLEEYRGKGIGLKLWKAAKEHLGDRNIGVRGDRDNFKKYTAKEGFCHVEDYTIVYYECFGDSLPTNVMSSSGIEIATYFEGNLIGYSNKLNKNVSSTNECATYYELTKAESGSKTTCTEREVMKTTEGPEKSLSTEKQYNSGKSSVEKSLPSSITIESISTNSTHGEFFNVQNQIRPNIESKIFHEFQKIPFNSKAEEILTKVYAFDKSLHNRDRPFLVRHTFSWSSCWSKVAVVGSKVVGYACLRNVVTEHWIISPFYADTKEVAEILLLELLQDFDFSEAPKGIQLRFPDKNFACKKLVEKCGFRELPTRISTGFTKQCINIDASKVYSFHSTVFCSE